MMNDLMLSEEDVFNGSSDEEDFYSSQAGDAISSKTQVKDRRRTYLGLTLLFCGLILVGIGVTVGSAGNRKNKVVPCADDPSCELVKEGLGPTPVLPPTTAPAVALTKAPSAALMKAPSAALTKAPSAALTKAPTTAIPTRSTPEIRTAPPFQTTAAPTAKKTLADHLNEWLGPDPLSSIAFEAYTWLSGNSKLDTYDIVVLRQRFTAAALHLATNANDSWNVKDGWMTDQNECDWYGIRCNDQGFLITFNLTSNGLSGLIPYEITLLSETLKSLDLSFNDLDNSYDELSWLAELTNLQILDVHETNFQADGIPSYLRQLADLRKLFLSLYVCYDVLVVGALLLIMRSR
jgi:hypothetical protein